MLSPIDNRMISIISLSFENPMFFFLEPYRKLRLQMRCENMIASTTRDFSVLSMVTDSWIPACEVWVGDYPYLDRTAFRDFIATIEPTKIESISNSFSPDDSSPGSVNKSERINRGKDSTQTNEIDNDKEFNSNRYFDGSSSGKYEHYGKNSDKDADLEEIEDLATLDYLDNKSKEQFIRKINKDGSRMKDGGDYDVKVQKRNSDKRSDTEPNNESRSQYNYDLSSQIIRSQQERRERSKRK